MVRWSGRLTAGLAALWIGSAVSVGDEPSMRRVPGWGEVVDPSGDCKVAFDPARDRLTIAVPGTPHCLSSEVAGLALDAPRVVQDVYGDFKVSVRVAGKLDPGSAKSASYDPYHGAGLIVWKDEQNYLRVERAVATIRGRTTPYLNDELREKGRLAFTRGIPVSDQPVYLKVERSGGQIRSWRSTDGSRWTELPGVADSMPGRVRVGVVAINSAKHPLRAELDKFRIEEPSDMKAEGVPTAATITKPAEKAGDRPEAK